MCILYIYISILFIFIEVIKSDLDLLMDDVLEEFASIDLVLKHMSEWKNKYLDSYIEAYVNVCLPKLIGPYVRLEMLTWNPLEVKRNYLIKSYSNLL